jgi:hypothetical protein
LPWNGDAAAGLIGHLTIGIEQLDRADGVDVLEHGRIHVHALASSRPKVNVLSFPRFQVSAFAAAAGLRTTAAIPSDIAL